MLDSHVNNIKTKWKDVIKSFINENPEKWATLNTNLQKQTEKLDDFLEIYPKPENIFKCFDFFDPEDTKVVILGQFPSFLGSKPFSTINSILENNIIW